MKHGSYSLPRIYNNVAYFFIPYSSMMAAKLPVLDFPDRAYVDHTKILP
jgi:hypothetical protein